MISLPIDSHLDAIVQKITQHDVVFLKATPGAGKTTRLPVACLKKFRRILVLQPRRIACISSAHRISEESNLQFQVDVGYEVRFEKRANQKTLITFMTDGLFLKKLKTISDYDLIILDEFHERSLASDLVLGLLRENLELEKTFKLVLMSATFNDAKISAYWDHSGLTSHYYEVQGQVFPLEIQYVKKSQRLTTDHLFFEGLLEACQSALNETALVFLPGSGEINHLKNLLESRYPQAQVEKLHGQLKLEEQKEVLRKKDRPRLILTTNIAESSLTVDGVTAVIDSGLQRISTYQERCGLGNLELARISRFSAQQRAGRAARQGPGRCLKLWSTFDEVSFPEETVPEILRSDLRESLLHLSLHGIRNFPKFYWMDAPRSGQIQNAQDFLVSHGLLNTDFSCTEKGRKILSLPAGLDEGLLLLEAQELNLLSLGIRLVSLFEEKSSPPVHDPYQISDLVQLLEHTTPSFQQKKLMESLMDAFKLKNLFYDKNLPQKITELLCRARFDHLCQRREPESRKAKHYSGMGTSLQTHSSVLKTEYFIAFHAQELKGEVVVRSAHGVEKNVVLRLAKNQIKTDTRIEIDFEKQNLYQINARSLGAFLLDESRSPGKLKEHIDQTAEALAYAILHLAPSLPEHFKELIQKLNWIQASKWCPEDFATVLFFTPEDLKAFCSYLFLGETQLSQVFAKNWNETFEVFLSAKYSFDLRSLHQQFPDNIELQRSLHRKIEYSGDTPFVESKLQDFFGTKEHPKIAGGKIPLKIILRGPHQRPIQITSDLPGFWKSSYAEIKKELKGQYPKHFWPEDPANELPPLKVRRG